MRTGAAGNSCWGGIPVLWLFAGSNAHASVRHLLPTRRIPLVDSYGSNAFAGMELWCQMPGRLVASAMQHYSWGWSVRSMAGLAFLFYLRSANSTVGLRDALACHVQCGSNVMA